MSINIFRTLMNLRQYLINSEYKELVEEKTAEIMEDNPEMSEEVARMQALNKL